MKRVRQRFIYIVTPGADETMGRPDTQVIFSGLLKGRYIFFSIMPVLVNGRPVCSGANVFQGNYGKRIGHFSVLVKPEYRMRDMIQVMGIHGYMD
jgi:hypothetical protein